MKSRILLVLVLMLLSNGSLHAERMRIPENTPRPLKVGVAVFVNSISRVADQAGTFEASVDIRLRWKNTELAFDAKQMGTNRLEFEQDAAAERLAQIWTPALALANATIQSTEQGLFIDAHGTVVHIQRVRAVFDADYRLDAFPFDTQNLPVRLVSERYSTNQIALVQDQRDIHNSGLSKELRIHAWQPQRLKFVSSRVRGWNGQFFPEMQAQIVLARAPTAHLLTTLMPFFLVLLIPTVATFFITLETSNRLGYIASSILALVALSFTYTSLYAKLPPDAMTTQLILIGSAYQILLVLLTVTIFNPGNADRLFANTFIIPELISYLRWAIPLALVGLVLTRVLLISLIS